METSPSETFQTLQLVIAMFKDIPGLIWGALIAVTGVLVSNWDNTRRLREQLAHDRDMKRAEREFNTKRDIYLDATEAIHLGLRSLPRFAQLDLPNEEITKEYTEKSAAIAKVHIIGTPKTILALNKFNMVMSKSMIELTAMRTPLLGERAGVLVDESYVANAQRVFEEVMEEYKGFNLSGKYSKEEHDRLQRNTDQTLARVSTLRDQHTQKSFNLNIKAIEIFKTAIRLNSEATACLPPLVESVREELGLHIDTSFMFEMQEQANRQLIQMGELFDSMLQAEAARFAEKMAQKEKLNQQPS